MLTHAENDLITRVGPGTPMGTLLRRYWFPVLKSTALSAGGAPKRVRLLGENFVAWRTTDGRIGFFDEGCPHRRASLVLGRNEGCALTCIFHGWKFDVDGHVLDVPSEPGDRERFGAKVKARHFPTREAGGLVWAFVGAGEPTQFPDLPFTRLPLDQVSLLEIPVNCNWVQCVEGQLDSSHVSNLHQSTVDTALISQSPSSQQTRAFFLADKAPSYEINDTAYGFQAAAIRHVAPGQQFVRVTEFAMPSWTCITNPEDGDFLMQGQMPVDDEHTVMWYCMHNLHHPVDRSSIAHGFQSMLDYDGTSFSRVANSDNNWTQDRYLLERGHFSGFKNILHEDIAIAESQGTICDRSLEYLGRSDAAIARFRRTLIDAAREQERGGVPRALGGDVNYGEVYGRQRLYDEGGDWRKEIEAVRV